MPKTQFQFESEQKKVCLAADFFGKLAHHTALSSKRKGINDLKCGLNEQTTM